MNALHFAEQKKKKHEIERTEHEKVVLLIIMLGIDTRYTQVKMKWMTYYNDYA